MITELVCTCPGMPNQYEGRIDGRPFYFRGRWGGWRLHVNSDTSGKGYDGTVVAYGEHHAAGWWTEAEAEAFLRELLAEYVARPR